MHLFDIRAERCTRCNLCSLACPARIIRAATATAPPEPVAGAAASCIDCGHCVAICPPAALVHRSMTPEQCPPLQRELLPTPEQAKHFLRSRRSIRNFRPEPVTREVLTRLIDIASHAPTGHNSQTVEWHVVDQGAEVNRLAGHVVDWMRYTMETSPKAATAMGLDRVVAAWEKGVDRVCRSSPQLIIAHAGGKDRFAPLSVPIALSYLELCAPLHGVGTCWGGYFNLAARSWPALQQALPLPDGNLSYGVLLVGRPRYEYSRLPLRRAPRISWS